MITPLGATVGITPLAINDVPKNGNIITQAAIKRIRCLKLHPMLINYSDIDIITTAALGWGK